jgi:hypothetical protein
MAAAIPFALLLATRLRGRTAATIWIALAALAVPWPADSRHMVLEASTIVVTVALFAMRDERLPVATSVAVLGAALYVGYQWAGDDSPRSGLSNAYARASAGDAAGSRR